MSDDHQVTAYAKEEEGPFPFEQQDTQSASPVPTCPPSSEVATPPVHSAPQKTALATSDAGLLRLPSIDDQMRFAETLIRNSMVSSSFKSPHQVVIAMQYLKELSLPVVAGMRLLYVVNNRPCLYSEGPLMLVQRSGHIESIEEFFFNEKMERISFENKNLKDKVYGSVTRVKRKGDDFVQEDYFTVDDMKTAKLDVNKENKPKEVWVKWERLMLRYKARAIALRSKFADVIGGVPIAEYDEDYSPEVPIKVRGTIAEELNQNFLTGQSKG